jgi:hypothetical protein
MAGYKAHMAMGMVLGLITGVVAVLVIAPSPFYAPLIFIAVVFGSFLPDLDSDTGISVKILFKILALSASGAIGFYLFDVLHLSIYGIIGGIIGCYIIINFGVRYLFKRITVHRGIFHSIAGVIISILLFDYMFMSINLGIFDSLLFSSAIGVGYLGHLILDETNSLVNLSGVPFIPKKSLGTALKPGSSSLRWNIGIVFVVMVLLFLNGRLIVGI